MYIYIYILFIHFMRNKFGPTHIDDSFQFVNSSPSDSTIQFNPGTAMARRASESARSLAAELH